MKKITLKDVAKHAGVCYQTVSKVLNNKADWVSEETRTRVMKSVDELGYIPNMAASSLRSGKKLTIGIVSGGHHKHMKNPDMARYYAGIGQRAEEAGYFITMIPQCKNLDDQGFAPRIRRVVQGRVVDGIIIMVFSHLRDTFINETLPILQEGEMPVVVLQMNAAEYGCPTVGYDITKAGIKATEHLVAQGITDIACIANDNPYGTDFVAGYRQAITAAGAQAYEYGMQHKKGVATGMLLADEALGTGLHRGYVIARDAVANGFIHQLRKTGKRVPEDAAVVSCDNLLDEDPCVPYLTCIDRKFEEHGYRAADMLFNILDGRNAATRDIIAPELIIRETT